MPMPYIALTRHTYICAVKLFVARPAPRPIAVKSNLESIRKHDLFIFDCIFVDTITAAAGPVYILAQVRVFKNVALIICI